MPVRGVRGATTVGKNDREEILERTGELLRALVERNGIALADIASAVFSVTGDIDAEFPAVAARRMGWLYTPLMCTREIPVPGSLPLCIRVLLHVNTDRPQQDIIHLYLREARKLRPDLDTGDVDRYYRSES